MGLLRATNAEVGGEFLGGRNPELVRLGRDQLAAFVPGEADSEGRLARVFTLILPVFSPRRSPRNASTVFSTPSTTVSGSEGGLPGQVCG
jgi:hypothetical protein